MKVVALTSFRNEAWILPTMMASLQGVADEILGFDDGSTDGSGKIFSHLGGQLVQISGVRPYSKGGEYDFRRGLLQAGREAGGTHFVCIDADEAFSCNFRESASQYLDLLSPGQRLSLQWTMLWDSPSRYRCDEGVWYPAFKDFIVRDSSELDYEPALMHLPRTPSGSSYPPLQVPPTRGVMLHYQFAYPDRTRVKQAWYRCIERVNKTMSAGRINHKYAHERGGKNMLLAQAPSEWLKCLPHPGDEYSPETDWRFHEIVSWFDEFGIEHFESLDIWDVPSLRDLFVSRKRREPRPKLLYSRFRSAYTRIVPA